MRQLDSSTGKLNGLMNIDERLQNTYALLETESVGYEDLKDRIKIIIDSAISMQDFHGVAMAYRLLALFHIRYNDGDMALIALGMAEAIIKKNDMDELLLELYIVYYRYYMEVESNEDEAAKYCLKGLHLADELNNSEWQVEYTIQLMQVNDIYHIYDSELQYALSQVDDIDCSFKVPLVIRQMSLCIDNDDYHYAFLINTQLLDKCSDTMSSEEMLEVYERRHMLCEELGLYQEAYAAHQMYHNIFKVLEKKKDENTIDRLEVIAQIGRDLTTIMKREDVLQEVYSRLKGLIDVASISIAVVDEDIITYLTHLSNTNKIITMKATVDDENSLGGWCIKNEKEVVINDLDYEYQNYVKDILKERIPNEERHIHSLINTPLRYNGDVIGMISVQSFKKYAYEPDDVELMQIISSYVAIGMINAKQADELKKLSVQDNLTGLSNRRGFVEAFDSKLNDETNMVETIGMIMIDLDHFKSINDQYGHLAGDQVLATIGDKLSHIYADLGDVIARLGGEEFALVVFNETEDIVEAIGEDIRKSIEALTIINNDAKIKLTASVGIAYTDGKESLNKLYNRADVALYEAKGTGRNKVVLHVFDDTEEYRYG